MVSMKKLLGSAAVLTLAGNASALTLFGTVAAFDNASGIQLAPAINVDSAEFTFTDLSAGVGFGTADLSIVFSDVSYASLDDSGNPFPPGAAPTYLTFTEVAFTGAFDANTNMLTGTGLTSNTAVGCTDIDPGACDSGPVGSSANDFIGFSLVSVSTPGWDVGTELDFSAGVTVSSVIDPSAIGAGLVRLEFTLFEAAAVPVPASVWFFGSGLMGLVAFNRRRGRKS